MGHAHHDTLNSQLCGSVDHLAGKMKKVALIKVQAHLLHTGDQHINTLEAKSLLAGPLLGKEPFKANTSANPEDQTT